MKRELFALGSAVYEIMAWEKPFEGLTYDEVEAKFENEEFPDVDGLAVGTTIRRCWDEKCEMAQEMVDAIEASLASLGT